MENFILLTCITYSFHPNKGFDLQNHSNSFSSRHIWGARGQEIGHWFCKTFIYILAKWHVWMEFFWSSIVISHHLCHDTTQKEGCIAVLPWKAACGRLRNQECGRFWVLPLPCPGRICPYKCWSTSGVSSCSWWHHSQLGAPSAPLPSSQPFTQTWDFGQLAAGARSSVSLPGKMISYKTLPHTFFKSLTATPLCSCKRNVPSHNKTCLCSLPPLKNIQTMNNKINVFSG